MTGRDSGNGALPLDVIAARYCSADLRSSLWQLINSFLPFFAVWTLMAAGYGAGYGAALALAPLGAGFLTRIFIIQHDCGHGSFFRSRRMNDAAGLCCSVLTLTPYHYWRKSHALHHAAAGNLEQRGVGDIRTMTVREYLSLSRWGRLRYRLYRNPFILFLLAPTILFLVLQRFPTSRHNALRGARWGILLTNLAIGGLAAVAIAIVGWKTFLAVQLPITVITSSLGMWLFYVQHQFEDTYWSDGAGWDFRKAALQGSSFYRLPGILKWFTGNIGFHHIHHLSPRIPNYLLERCHEEVPAMQSAPVLSLRTSLRSLPLTLWDEDRRKLIRFADLERR